MLPTHKLVIIVSFLALCAKSQFTSYQGTVSSVNEAKECNYLCYLLLFPIYSYNNNIYMPILSTTACH